MGPAERVSTSYTWPDLLPMEAPREVWYAPLLLPGRIPESVSATLPCQPTPALVDAKDPTTVFSTARHPSQAGGLFATRENHRLSVWIGRRLLARVPLSSQPQRTPCSYQMSVRDGRWSMSGGPRNIFRERDLGFMPVVNGFFSQLDLGAQPSPFVDVTTRPHSTRPTERQQIGWVVAALLTLASLALVAFDARGRRVPRRATTRAGRNALNLRSTDAAVAIGLLAWWVLSPAHWDDGWIMARQSGFESVGGFSNYYDSFGANLPNGYWLEWLQHWLMQSSNTLILLRAPALSVSPEPGFWLDGSSHEPPRRTDSAVARWALVAAFLIGALAWGMTLRPEPMIALLVTAVMACAVQFLDKAAGPLAVAALLIPLAMTGHHAGLVAWAPVLAIAPHLLAWIRINFASATALATAVRLIHWTRLCWVGHRTASARRSVDPCVRRQRCLVRRVQPVRVPLRCSGSGPAHGGARSARRIRANRVGNTRLRPSAPARQKDAARPSDHHVHPHAAATSRCTEQVALALRHCHRCRSCGDRR